jgi:glycosyltransferase involved in cell wall biosynthesis
VPPAVQAPEPLLIQAWNLRLDALAHEVTRAFAAAGIESILLKGPSIVDWLYEKQEGRAYADVDLMVAPGDWNAAQDVLRDMGFVDGLAPLGHPRMESHTSHPWARAGIEIDLHCTLWGVEAPPETLWRTLSALTEERDVGGKPLRVLAPAARALHLALHAAQHGPIGDKPLEDLYRALGVLPVELWGEAASLAEQLEATGAFVGGLRLMPGGRQVVTALGIQEMASINAVLRAPSVPMAEGFEQLARTRGLRAKLRLVRAEMFPTKPFMRWWMPLARRGSHGLLAAYAWRLVWLTLRTPHGLLAWRRARRRTDAAPLNRGGHRSWMRIAFIGPCPGETGGAPNVGTHLLPELARAGIEVDCYLPAARSEIPASLLSEPGLRFVCEPQAWEWGRWYSRIPLLAFFTGNASRLLAQRRLVREMVMRHRERRYDVVYQFSQTEMPSLRRSARFLPPIVVHPSTHAAGELKWHRREAALSKKCESLGKRFLVRSMLHGRAVVQKRDLANVARVLGISRRFNEHLARDYEVPPDRLGLVPYPIDLDMFRPNGTRDASGGPLWLLFVSRMSARKGVEMVVELSHRLEDLAGRVRIAAVGGPTTWSDYRPLLDELNPRTAESHGNISREDLARSFRRAGVLLQPSLYEPFALTVGEALASGLPVVASDEVGAAEGVDPSVCVTFPAGDIDAFEKAVRDLVDRLEREDLTEVSRRARAEAERLWTPPEITRGLIEELARACGRSSDATPAARPTLDTAERTDVRQVA